MSARDPDDRDRDPDRRTHDRDPGDGNAGGDPRRRDGGRDPRGTPDRRAARAPPAPGGIEVAGMVFTRKEAIDLAVAWVALGVAFTAFLFRPGVFFTEFLAFALSVSMATVGVGFLLHELAHKVVAVRFGQVAHFQADYSMLFVAVMAGLAGFLFAAPGAVVHQGRITPREHGLIALAGPVTNLLLAALFLPLVFAPRPVGPIAHLGLTINAFLAAFNMIPFGPLDGKTVLNWSKAAFAAAFVVSAGSVVALFYTIGFGIFGI